MSGALVNIKSTVKILSIFVSFLENMNFNANALEILCCSSNYEFKILLLQLFKDFITNNIYFSFIIVTFCLNKTKIFFFFFFSFYYFAKLLSVMDALDKKQT